MMDAAFPSVVYEAVSNSISEEKKEDSDKLYTLSSGRVG